MKKWLWEAQNLGIEKVNLDFMYGLRGQTPLSVERDLELIEELRPEQVTIYELRTNMLAKKDIPSKDYLYRLYSMYYDGLTGMGYEGRFGRNTFTTDPSDEGLSSYLRERMLRGASYKGFGLGAQSLGSKGLSYNLGKGRDYIKDMVSVGSYPEEYTYILPPEELFSKYMAISAYGGSFSLEKAREYGLDPERFEDRIRFCLNEGLLELEEGEGRYRITREGFRYYGAVFSLFFA